MIFDRLLGRAIQTLGMLAIATAAAAQNTIPNLAISYIVDQGWVQTTLGPTVGTNEQRWYVADMKPGRSYCLETTLGDNTAIDSDTEVWVFETVTAANAGTPVTATNDDFTGLASFSRACFVYTGTTNFGSRLGIRACCTNPPATADVFATARAIRFRFTDTTVTAPWWFVSSSSGYNAFAEIANNDVNTVNIVVRVLSPSGAVLGTTVRALPGKGNVGLSVASNFGVTITSGNGSIELAHDGPVGAINLNVTSLSAVEGLSFDSPGTRKTTW